MATNFDENRVQEILSILKSQQVPNAKVSENQMPLENKPFDEKRVQEAIKVLRGTSEEKKPEKEFSWPRFLGEKFTKGVLNLADFPQTLIESTGNPNLNLPEREWTRDELNDFSKNRSKPIISSSVESLANKAGVDLHSHGEGETSAQKIAGKAAEFAGSSLIPGGGFPGLARNIALGGTIGAETGALEELGAPEPIAALASLATVLAGAPALKNAFNKALSSTPNLSDAEKRVANYLQQALGEGGVESVSKNISESPKYPMTSYEPTTAEVSNNPMISTLHRLRQGIAGTGLQERAGAQNEAIHKVADELSSNAMKSGALKETIGNEVSARKTKLYSETEPLYKELRKDKTEVELKFIKDFFKENNIVKGKKRKDLDAVMKLIQPSEKLTPIEEGAFKNYENQVEAIMRERISDSAKEQAISQLEKPKSNNPTVADLDEARQNINDMINDLERSGQNNRARQLREAKKALDKDLEPFHLQKEATAKYAELSKPVNEILEHPTLKNIPESRLNDIFESLYNNKSSDNLKSLKNVLKDRPEEWKGVQDATVEYLMKSIRNAGAEGRKNVLSYHKLDKFLEKHQKALDEVFTVDQMKFLDELKNSLKGKNIAETLGVEKQSATYGKLMTGTNLTGGLGTKLLKGLTYVPHALPIPKVGKATGEALRTMLNGYFKTREADVMQVLDNFLKEPEYATKLLNHKFKTQADFNKKMNDFLKQSATLGATEKEQ